MGWAEGGSDSSFNSPKSPEKSLNIYAHQASIYLCTTATGRTSKVVTVSLHALTPSLLCMHVHLMLGNRKQKNETQ